ncbi:MAG TPA: DUF58 domain-containing protein [Gemmatimonadetes bacterium]|nr:DUF58 domain-containing protein [Gemmatimonadota bacterium]
MKAVDGERVFSKEVTAQLRRIELRTRGLVESLFSGEYRSVFKGRGMEFSDVREYQPGDDVRAIDWNVTARRGRLFVKEHVDFSASKDFGTGLKRNVVIASEIAAILALAATDNNDRVGLLVVTDRVELYIPLDSGRRHAMRLVLELLSFCPSGRGTKLSAALEYAAKVLHQRTAVFLISDFLLDDESDPPLASDARRFSREHDLIPIRITDPGAATLPNVGLLALADPETGIRRVVNTSEDFVRQAYSEGRSGQRVAIDKLFRQLRMDAIEVTSTEDYVLPLIRFFRRRERVAR